MPKSLYAKTSLKFAFKKGFKEVLQMCPKENVKHKLSNIISPCIIMIGPQFCDFIPNNGDFTNNLKIGDKIGTCMGYKEIFTHNFNKLR
jgi:hypothetical protein